MNGVADFFGFFEQHSKGVLLFLLTVFFLIWMISWLVKILRPVRKANAYGSSMGSRERLGFVIARFFANIIDDFRHFLALTLVIIFTILIVYSMATAGTFEEKMKALQLVIASIGTLLGSIIGYYFGESAASKSQGQGTADLQRSEEGVPVENEMFRGVETESFAPSRSAVTEEIKPVTPPEHLIPDED